MGLLSNLSAARMLAVAKLLLLLLHYSIQRRFSASAVPGVGVLNEYVFGTTLTLSDCLLHPSWELIATEMVMWKERILW